MHRIYFAKNKYLCAIKMNCSDFSYKLWLLCAVAVIFACTACGRNGNVNTVDALNTASYQNHYRNLDRTRAYATRALRESDRIGYGDGRAEALNNLAFVSLAKMSYGKADSLLQLVQGATDNQIELLVSDIQLMRLCQRTSDNKNFYHHNQRALLCIRRIEDDADMLTPRQRRRMVYARSEYAIVMSTYLYYVGLKDKSASALDVIDPNGEIVKDTAQMLAYLYNVGAGGIINASTNMELRQEEFDYLMRCYMLSRQYNYVYWEANSLQALSEHIQDANVRKALIAANRQEFDYLNESLLPDSLLAGNLSERALRLFRQYGDTYQTAGSWRTLSEAYMAISDYPSALACLNQALSADTAIHLAPDLVASIREQLSIVYSAMDNKRMSDYNRNLYLDIQEHTRQDRMLEARAEQLSISLKQLDYMIITVVALIVALVCMLAYFVLRRRRRSGSSSVQSQLHDAIGQWRIRRDSAYGRQKEHMEEIVEQTEVASSQKSNYLQRNIEQRAKVYMASCVMPIINRMRHEVHVIADTSQPDSVRSERLEYVSLCTQTIDSYNRQLTQWIQMRKGDFLLHIESFRLQELFNSLAKSAGQYEIKGVRLCVTPTDAVVKADRVLTFFMLNTIADNARRYTRHGGFVRVYSEDAGNYIEISIADNGCGMTPEQTAAIFSGRIADSMACDKAASGVAGDIKHHGFGLVSCKGIIEKYRKLGSLFSVCEIGAESELGKGSRFFFRLPKGMAKMIVAVAVLLGSAVPVASVASGTGRACEAYAQRASAFADSTYYANIRGDYARALEFADSCIHCLNSQYSSISGKGRLRLMRLVGDYPSAAAELEWFHDSVGINYDVVLDVRNESAVAALALHQWQLYSYNNGIYTQLFRELSADSTLPTYVRTMIKAEANRNVAVIILVMLLVTIVPFYYFVYYRHRLYYHMWTDRARRVARLLGRTDLNDRQILEYIDKEWQHSGPTAKRDKCPESIDDMVKQLQKELKSSVEHGEHAEAEIAYMSDNLRRITFDRDRLYVSNNILEGCLSSLKHETMYYPSRLHQLVAKANDTSQLESVAGYYALIYSVLLRQATDMLDNVKPLLCPTELVKFLYTILRRKNNGVAISAQPSPSATGTYTEVCVPLNNLSLSDSQIRALFTPNTCDVDFLVCCQIMRDIGNISGARGCGINAVSDNGKVIIKIKITTELWKSLQL